MWKHLSLPTGTLLPGGAVFTMSSVLEFPTWIPPGKFALEEMGASCHKIAHLKTSFAGTKMPGGMVTPVCILCFFGETLIDRRAQVSMGKPVKFENPRYEAPPEPVCLIM